MKKVAVQADIVISSSRKILKNHVVVHDTHTIIDLLPLDEFKRDHPTIELLYKPNSILTPGFINAHTHLELSFIHRIKKFTSFFDWVNQINEKRASVKSIDQLKINQEIIKQTVSKGTIAFGDITNTGTLISFLEDRDIISHSFIEVLGFNSNRAEEIWTNVNTLYKTYLKSKHVSLSPHAVYSLSSEILTHLANEKKLESIHIDEIRAERKFLKNATGEIRTFIDSLNIWDENWTIPQESPLDYIESFNFKDLIYVHLLHLTEAEFQHLKKSQKIVLCPRSNQFLHGELPKISHFLNNGLSPALGTDSLASNDDLSILNEMKFVAKEYKIPHHEIFKMGTENGANVLNFSNLGSIEKKKRAICNYFQFDVISPDPIKQILTEDYRSLETLNI